MSALGVLGCWSVINRNIKRANYFKNTYNLMKTNQLITPPYECPLTRVVWVNTCGAFLDTSTKNAKANGFSKEWDEDFWEE